MLGTSQLKSEISEIHLELMTPDRAAWCINPHIEDGDFVVECFNNGTHGSADETFTLTGEDDTGAGADVLRVGVASPTISIQVSAAIKAYDTVIIRGSKTSSNGNNWAFTSALLKPDLRKTQLAHLDADVSSASATDITALEADVTAVLADLDNGVDGLGALKTLIDTINTKTTAIKNFTAAKM